MAGKPTRDASFIRSITPRHFGACSNSRRSLGATLDSGRFRDDVARLKSWK
jgi:hypothetical protein